MHIAQFYHHRTIVFLILNSFFETGVLFVAIFVKPSEVSIIFFLREILELFAENGWFHG